MVMIRVLLLPLLLLWTSLVCAQEWRAGDTAVFRAEHPLGGPLHREPRPSLVGRALDGSGARVVGTQPNSRWVQVETPSEMTALVAKIKMPELNRELWPMLGLQILVLALITLIPQLSTALPTLLGSR